METLYFAKNVTSAMGVSEARGVVTLCLAQHNIPLGEYKPNQIKQAVTGTAAADKELVEKYEVMAAPTLVFFKNGSETGRIRGAAGKDEIIKHIDELQ